MSDTTQLSNWKTIVAFIRSIAGQSNVLTVPRLFLDLTGDLSLAVMLSQLIYWSERTSRPDGFIFKSSADWYKEVGASDHAVRKFKTLPYIETRLLKANGSPTTHYRVNFELLLQALNLCLDTDQSASPDEFVDNDESIGCIQQNHSLKTTKPFVENNETLTEITTKTTTEITTLKGPPQKNSKMTPPARPKPLQDHTIPARDPDPPPDYQSFLGELSLLTGFDISLRSHASRLGRTASQLLQAGYTVQDLKNFFAYWKEKDWRWKKDRQLPSPEDVLTLINRSRIARKRTDRSDYMRWCQT